MKNSLGKNQSDSDFKLDEVSDSSEEDDTSLTGIENISKAAKNHEKKWFVTDDENLDPSYFQVASISKSKSAKRLSSLSFIFNLDIVSLKIGFWLLYKVLTNELI